MALTTIVYDLAALLHTVVLRAPVDPTPTPTPTGTPFDFDWDQIRPDPDAVPKTGIFYDMANALLFLGVIAALSGLLAGAIAFAVGPIFGAHIISDRGKSMMWKAGLAAVIVGSATTIITVLLAK
ncbi:hypothetical protein [Actinoplanes sp. GCM10030250]|uniref:hypothetical protein n=1 Tax=Actinoplanes sp. GCM10030250 TaxID=3273376 RepID=UPI003615F098